MPEGDPYDRLLKPLLERDSKQYDAWKDEVQNILIFAGLLSAVITAFIVESYQKLQPDPNDQIVLLLSRISDQLTNSLNDIVTPSVPSINTPFTPLRSDVRVNIFWFISLVLSLTVIFYRGKIELHCPLWMDDMSKQWTLILTNIIQISLEITPSKFGALHACSSSPPCGSDVRNNNVKDLMKYILLVQVPEDIKHTLRLLHLYCTLTPDPINYLPYDLVHACAYVDAVAAAGCWEGVVEFHTLLETVSSICGHQTQNLSFGVYYAYFRSWDGLEPALTYIRNNHTQMSSNIPKHEPLLEISDSPVLHRKNKAPDNV